VTIISVGDPDNGGKSMKVAVVGCGNISRFHFRAILGNPLAQLTALCDRDEALVGQMAERIGVKSTYTDFDTLLNKEELDVLHVCTPPSTHPSIAIKAIERGLHVLVEKPMALDVSDADKMIKAARRKKVKLCVNHNAVFEPVICRARDIVNSYDFGELIHISTYFAFDARRVLRGAPLTNRGPMSWYGDLKGNILQDLFPHPASIVLSFMHDYTACYPILKAFYKEDGIEDEARMLLDSDKVTGNITLSLRTSPDIFTIDLYGSKMILRVDFANMSLVKQKPRDIPKFIARAVDNMSQANQICRNTVGTVLGVLLKRVTNAGGIDALVNEFYKSIDRDWPVPVSGEEGKKVVDLAQKLWT
jgi:predicted dehydrogenase